MLGSLRALLRAGAARSAPSLTSDIRDFPQSLPVGGNTALEHDLVRKPVPTFRDHALPAAPHLMRGSTLNWWNGGGDDSVHSSVVAPAPHGLPAACSLRRNA